jgi:hypothetical protein
MRYCLLIGLSHVLFVYFFFFFTKNTCLSRLDSVTTAFRPEVLFIQLFIACLGCLCLFSFTKKMPLWPKDMNLDSNFIPAVLSVYNVDMSVLLSRFIFIY